MADEVDTRFASADQCHLKDVTGALLCIEDWPVPEPATIAFATPAAVARFVARGTARRDTEHGQRSGCSPCSRPTRTTHRALGTGETRQPAGRPALGAAATRSAGRHALARQFHADRLAPVPGGPAVAVAGVGDCPRVYDALRRARQRRNHALEDEVAHTLVSHGLQVVRGVKKPQVIGLAPGVLPGGSTRSRWTPASGSSGSSR